jgi:ubiquinone/menaquinone biosynthesis C-methylase UbiE
MAKHHFVQEYERLVEFLLRTNPLDKAMSLAVGGSYHEVGTIEFEILRWAGLKDGMTLIDLGCGSGRLAHVLGQRAAVDFIGIDVVQSLLDYAQSKSPPHYKFILHHDLTIPAPDDSADFVSAFSVFTHLLPAESYLYMQDIRRVLRPGGSLVFSFLEFADPAHWSHFANEVEARRTGVVPHLNTHIERPVIRRWCAELGYVCEAIVAGNETPWQGKPMGQSTAVLQKRE